MQPGLVKQMFYVAEIDAGGVVSQAQVTSIDTNILDPIGRAKHLHRLVQFFRPDFGQGNPAPHPESRGFTC
jgi:hypothetical protein